MKITFLGTRGYIEARNDRHRRHTATLVEYRGAKLMIDCGLDWEEEVFEIDPDLIAITHAHPDHAFGLKDTAPCPVHATQTSWDKLGAEGLARFATVPYGDGAWANGAARVELQGLLVRVSKLVRVTQQLVEEGCTSNADELARVVVLAGATSRGGSGV